MAKRPKAAAKKAKAPKKQCFVGELPLVAGTHELKSFGLRLRAGCDLYNAVLGDGIKRLRACRQDPDWAAARAMPKTIEVVTEDGEVEEVPNKARSELFQEVCRRHLFTEEDLQKAGRKHRDACWIGDHIGSHDGQAIVSRVWAAFRRHLYEGAGRPRFKPLRRMRSIEGKSANALIRFKAADAKGPMRVEYSGLIFPVKLRDPKDRDGWVAHLLSCPLKYARIMQREIRGRMRLSVQLVVKGVPLVKEKHAKDRRAGDVGFDLGPGAAGVVALPDDGSEGYAEVFDLAGELEEHWKAVRRLQRREDRSRRAMNPDFFDEQGRWKNPNTGLKKDSPKRVAWKRSKRGERAAAKRRERERRVVETRKTEQGRSINELLRHGNVVHAEDVSVKGWQKGRYGKAIRRCAPAEYQGRLVRKAESAGGRVEWIDPWQAKLSQYDHTTDDCVKKRLNERRHVFRDGSGRWCQRDLYSAWLAVHWDGQRLDAPQLVRAWAAVESLLRSASEEWNERARAKREASRSRRSARRRSPSGEKRPGPKDGGARAAEVEGRRE